VPIGHDVHALATRDARSAAVLVWNYHDDDLPAPASEVRLTISGLPAGRPTVTHHRIDDNHSNAYAAWKRLGSPQPPSSGQFAALERASRLATLGPPSRAAVVDGRAELTFTLPRQGVSLVRLTW
jgi:xylan 1,4-beta-xylosidase